MASHPFTEEAGERMRNGGFKVQVQQRIIQTSQEMAKRSHGKDGKQKDVFHFPTTLRRLSI
jgi:hypothetical protein